MSLEAFGVKNLRCLVDTGLVPIRPITVLVGRNSSGKSTFLRAFPLLRQSVETRRNTPILWYGDEHPVDFGSLRDAASAWLDEPSVTFMFRLRLPENAGIALDSSEVEIEMTLTGGEIPYVSEYRICMVEHEVRWIFGHDGKAKCVRVNGQPLSFEGQVGLGGHAHLLPTLRPEGAFGVIYWDTPRASSIEFLTPPIETDEVLLRPLVDVLRPLLIRDDITIQTLVYLIRIGTRKAMLKEIGELLGRAQDKGTKKQTATLDATVEDAIISRALVRLSPRVIEVADSVLAHFMGCAAYLAPLRVSAQRAYRITNYAVDEVAPDGKNLAMFLRSLSQVEVESFASFTREALGFETNVKTTGIHAEILVRAGGSRRLSNLVDVGFGYSEVLPLAAVLWNSCIRPSLSGREPVPLVAVEQPELHLHPAHQARLARMLVEAVSKSPGTRIVVETHSESLINGLGKLIYEGAIKASDVQIALFDQDDETEKTSVRLAGYRDNGALHDWPYGFLSPVAARRAPPAAAE